MEREGWGELGERERDAVRELEREGFWKRVEVERGVERGR